MTDPAISLKAVHEPTPEQIRAALRLQDAATVAGRVAHDLDNVFQAITGFTELTLSMIAPGSPTYQNLQEVNAAADRGMKFCHQLHQLSRSGTTKPSPSSIALVAGKEITRLKKGAGENLRFEVDTPSDLPAVAIDGAALQIVFGHLLDNAVEASPAQGLIRFVGRVVELPSGIHAQYHGSPAPGLNVEVRISDQGPGVSEEERRRMFSEPFFTKKVRHRGLGLTVVHRILYAHKAGVRVDSNPPSGTVVTVVLPIAPRGVFTPSEASKTSPR